MTDVTDPNPSPVEAPQDAADGPAAEQDKLVEEDKVAEEAMERPGWWRLVLVAAALLGLWWWQGLALVVVIVSLVFMITMHELGHYLTAKRAGMKVTQFFVGFGPRVWSVRRGETEYGIRAIPAGAFVKVPGMLRDEQVAPEDEARSYRQASFKDRVTMASAGSAMHFIMAFILLFIQFSFFGQQDPDQWSVAEVLPGSAAAAAGIQPGDRIVSVDGQAVSTTEDLGDEVRKRAGETVPVEVQRDGQTVALEASLGARASVIGTVGEDLGLFFTDEGGAVKAFGDRAVDAGLNENDIVTEINGVALTRPEALVAATEAAEGGELAITYLPAAGGDATTTSLDLGTAVAATKPEGMIGTTSEYAEIRKNPWQATTASVGAFWELSTGSISGLVRVMNPANLADFFGRAATARPDDGNLSDTPTPASTALRASQEENETRPISMVGAASLATGFAEADWASLLMLMAVLNIFIGLFNLTPLLPFDGGHIAIACYERIRERMAGDGKRYFIDPKRMYPVAVAVVSVLGLLFLSTVYLDVVNPIRI
ncbi:MAG: site-2 protease family protein [Microthrixaceae bacterium]